MSERLNNSLNRRLSGLKWQPMAQETLQKARERKQAMDEAEDNAPVWTHSRRLRMALLAGLVLTVLAATALAIGLRYSQRVSATLTAREAVMAKYGLTQEAMDMFWAEVTEKNGETVTTLSLGDGGSDYAYPRAGSYTVTVQRNGKTEVRWSHDNVDPALYANGSLEAEVWGAKQIVAYRAQQDEQHRREMEDFKALVEANQARELSAEEEAYQRENLLRRERYVSAITGEVLSQEAEDGLLAILEASVTEENPEALQNARLTLRGAVELAGAALKNAYGLTDRTLRLFQPVVELRDGIWTVRFRAPYYFDIAYDWLESDKLGGYRASLTDADGKVMETAWTLEGEDEETYTRETWGQAQAYSADILPWMIELIKAYAPIKQRERDNVGTNHSCLSVEDKAAYDQFFRDAGFDAAHYNHVLPQEGDIGYEQAEALVAQILDEELGVSRAVFDGSAFAYADLQQEGDRREWYFWVQNAEVQCSWTVVLDAQTGEVLLLLTEPMANGNG